MSASTKYESIPESVADEWRASPLSILFFSWLYPLLKVGAARPLQRSDLGASPTYDRVAQHAAAFERSWASTRKTLASLTTVFWSRMRKGVACKAIGDACGYAQIFAVKAIVTYAEHKQSRDADGTAWSTRGVLGPARVVDVAVAVMVVCPALQGLCNHWFYHHVMIDGLHARSALKSALFRKLLRVPGVGGGNADASISAKTDGHVTAAMSGKGGGGGGSGKLLNLQNSDARAVEHVYHMCLYIVFVPVQLAVYFYWLAREIGLATVVGLGVMVLGVPAQMSIVGRMKQAQGALMAAADERMRGVKETVQAMLAVKVFGWEASFRASVKQARRTELAHSLRLQTLGAGANAVMEAVPILCALASLGSYGLLYPDRPLTASRAFVALLVFNQLRMPLMILPMTIQFVVAGLAAVARIDDFLGAAECESYVDRSTTDGATVRVVDGAFAWPASLTATPDDATDPFALRIADLGLGKGLNVVVGAVASGKSTLLAALLGELERTSGTVAVRGRVALCPQAPWIFNATLKENVLFGADYDAVRYARCVDACALGPDLEALPDGDRSEIGERGITLSGGQKARVSLARALYADADVYLLDDVLSAVDAHVGRHIVDRVLLDLLGDKTVILASHQLSCLDRAATVVVLKGGAVAFAGTPADCYAADALEGIRGESDDATGAASASREIAPTAPPAPAKVDEERKDDATADAGKLTTAEDRVVGTVSMRVLRSYARLCGTCFVFLVVAFLVLKTAGAVCAQAWVAEWTDATADEADDGADDGLNVRETRYYISGYAVVSFVTVAFVVANQLAAVNASAVASAEVHGLAFDAVVRAPLAYFEVTPPGRILARFGNDINVVDAMLMTSLNASGGQLAVLAAVFALCAILVPWLAPLTLPLFVVYWKMADLYRKSSRELKRLENMAETPVYSGFASCMDGLLTIRAFEGASERLVVQTDATIDDWAACWLKNNGANRWMGMRLDAIGAALVGLVALFCVLRVDGLLGMGSSFDAGRVGLMLSFAAAVSGILNWCVRGVAEAEQHATSLERCLAIADVAPEDWGDDAKSTGNVALVAPAERSWPTAGRVTLEKVSMRYRPNLPTVLDGISLTIAGGERVGVCGRTGSGKSSLATAQRRVQLVSGVGWGVGWGVGSRGGGVAGFRGVGSFEGVGSRGFAGVGSRGCRASPSIFSSRASIWALSRSSMARSCVTSAGASAAWGVRGGPGATVDRGADANASSSPSSSSSAPARQPGAGCTEPAAQVADALGAPKGSSEPRSAASCVCTCTAISPLMLDSSVAMRWSRSWRWSRASRSTPSRWTINMVSPWRTPASARTTSGVSSLPRKTRRPGAPSLDRSSRAVDTSPTVWRAVVPSAADT